MTASFPRYEDAHRAAVTLARQLGKDVGLLKAKEYNATVFQVFSLPKPENRYGFELQCQVVTPADPYMAV